MYTNADVTLYLYGKEGKTETYTRTPIEDVYWEDVRQSTYLKTGQRAGTSVLLAIPLESLPGSLKFTPGRDLAVKGIVTEEIDCSSQEALSKSLAAFKASHSFVAITSVDERLYGGDSVQHYELACQ